MRALILTIAAALLIATISPSARANEGPIDDRDFGGGSAMDHIAYIAATPFHFLPRQFWMTKYMLGTLEGRILLYHYWLLRMNYWWWRPMPQSGGSTADTPEDSQLSDEPAESILDQMDEADAELPMVGMPGQQLQTLDAMGAIGATGATPTPPPVSILDEIDESPKPAVNQATPPKLVEAPR